MISAYPLAWPPGFPRSKGGEPNRFKTTLAGALKNVEGSLNLFGRDSGKTVTSIVLSSNVSLGNARPSDPGVAAWFVWDGDQVCIPVDRYGTVEANLQAIHHVIEARRVELRHGTLALVKASMRGFLALPSPEGAKQKRHWTDVMEYAGSSGLTRGNIEDRYRKLARERHPDRQGGSVERMAELNVARDEALKELSA